MNHAIQDFQSPGIYLGCNTESGALAEGFSDYWAASSTYEISVANNFAPSCLFEWNGNNTCPRTTSSPKHYPEDKVGECHQDGEIWSAALWSLFL